MKVGIYYEYDHLDYINQTPNRSGEWDNIKFIINELDHSFDVFIILNQNTKPIQVECGSEVWAILQEPPIKSFPWMFDDHSKFNRVFGPIENKKKKKTRYYNTHGALPWHVNKNYNDLVNLSIPYKKKNLSLITSNKSIFSGHIDRMKFLQKLQKSDVKFDLYGIGFNYIGHKFDALYPYKYSLVIENYAGENYWTEKIADCFLSWTMPIYYGCTNITEYFPSESLIKIDIRHENVIDQIKEVLLKDPYLESLDAIRKARNLVFNKYQLFPYIHEKINSINIIPSEKNKKLIKPYKESIKFRIRRSLGIL